MGFLHTLLYYIKEQGAEFNDRPAAATNVITAKFQFIAPCVITTSTLPTQGDLNLNSKYFF